MDISYYLNVLYERTPREVLQRASSRLAGRSQLERFNDKHPCVFVMSTGRTGTQTLAYILGLASNIFAYHEPLPLMFRLSKLSYECSDVDDATDPLVEGFYTAREHLLTNALRCGRGYVETGPHNTFLARIILKIIPQVKFIHLVRNPGDVVRSGMRRNWYGGNKFDSFRILPKHRTEDWNNWDRYSLFQKNVWLWKETNRWLLELAESLPSDKMILVKSEMVFSEDEETLKRLFAFIGSHGPLPSKRIKRVLRRRYNAQQNGMYPNSEMWTDDLQFQMSEITGSIAQALGY